MKMSDLVAEYIVRQLNESDGSAEIRRNELADLLGCVPSQINYVITSRFTPEQGYIVESRRGGGGYIRITRVCTGKNAAVMHIVGSVGDSISASEARVILRNMQLGGLLDPYETALMLSAVSEKPYTNVEADVQNSVRASILKNMLLTSLTNM